MFIAALFALSAQVRAQPAATPEGSVTPPRLLESVEPTYPPRPTPAEDRYAVGLEVTVDREGKATEAEVVESAGSELDQAARDAAFKARFEPARRANGDAIPSRIVFRVVFEYPPADAGTAALAPVPHTPAPAAPSTPRPTEATEATEAGVELKAKPLPEVSEVAVHAKQGESAKLEQSAEAVVVLNLRKAHAQTADLGEVMARMQGVAIRRDGGLGSTVQFALNGLQGDQVAMFVDGVPLEYAGFPFGFANIPVNLVERVEIYRGVVPVRFGADALGGAVNFVTDQHYKTRLGVSYQVGSFATHRLTLDGLYRHQKTGFIVGGTAFADKTKNNYDVDVDIPDAKGRPQPATVPRFHDRYSSYGLSLRAGVVDQPWARRLVLEGYTSGYHKELQNNAVMTVPYGEVNYGERLSGLTLRFDSALTKKLDLELVGNYSHRVIDFVDKADWVYDWNGQRVRERRTPGEIQAQPIDQTVWQDAVFWRGYLSYALSRTHTFRFSMTPTYTTRTGEDRALAEGARDPLDAKRKRITLVSGLEYELNLWNDRLANIAFVKDYLYHASTAELLPGNILRDRDVDSHTQGIGDSLRYRLTPWLMVKGSYEYTTRLPKPDEVFGDGKLVQANLQIEPEKSHNFNLGPRMELKNTAAGEFTVDVNLFYRDSDNLIVLLGNDRFFTYQNVFRATNLGVENSLNWVSPGSARLLTLGGTFTYQDFRNASSEGTFGAYDGDRIPYRPYMFGSWHGHFRFTGLPTVSDAVEPYYFGRYVHEFYRGWESQGQPKYKQTVGAQVVHTMGVSWIVTRPNARWVSTFEIDNVADAKVFENYGIQRPGRAFYLKMSGDI